MLLLFAIPIPNRPGRIMGGFYHNIFGKLLLNR
jgi:hypothetical protein